jgi:hypothetical protein
MFNMIKEGIKRGELTVITAGDSTGKSKFIEQPSLEELLEELYQYGKPRVGVYGSDGKWYCAVEMNTNTAGADFKCASEFDHATPTEAARVCLERVLKAVEQYKK